MRIRPKFEPDPTGSTSSERPPPTTPAVVRRGELLWRSVRYAVVLFVGYLLGLSAGSMVKGPGFWACAVIGLVALWLVFRQGRNSISHAAADVVTKANARAAAAAVNQNHITVAGGHVLQHGQGAPPPIEAYERDTWADFRAVESTPVYEIGADAITGVRLFDIRGVIKREDALTAEERSFVVPLEVQSPPDYERPL